MIIGFEKFGFSRKSLEIFKGSFIANREQGNYTFPCSLLQGFSFNRSETVYFDGTRLVPSEFFWEVSPVESLGKRNVFLFQSATDAMAFLELKGLEYLSNSILVAIGSSPSFSLIEALKSRPYGNFVLCFPNDFFGRLCDVKVGLFLSGFEASMEISDDGVVIEAKGRRSTLKETEISLSKFEKVAGVNLKIRTLKPSQAATFFEELRLVRQRKNLAV